jgi:hypothetical protein
LSAADDLHGRIFGFTPAKSGTAYERLAAVVLAGLGWESVKHETKLRPEGRRAQQRLDVTATHPDGSIRHLLVECKDWNKEVGKGTMDALVGVRDQAGFDAAMAVTTIGFTSGAVDVAVDEDVAMVILREHRPEDQGRFVRRVEAELKFFFPSFDSFDLVLAESDLPVGKKLIFSLGEDDRLTHLDGTPAETLREVLESNAGALPREPGDFERSADFADGRLIAAQDGTAVPISALKWIERIDETTETVVAEGKGEPCLVLEQLDQNGEPEQARLVVDQALYAWDIGGDGTVTARGELR